MDVYADNAATTRLGAEAFEAMVPYMREAYGNPSSIHSLGQRAKGAIDDARATIARHLGADGREITFTSCGSESDTQAILSAAKEGAKRGKRHIVSTAFEHPAVLRTLERLATEGYETTLIRPDGNGIVSPASIEEAIREETALVSVIYANNEIGTIQPVSEIAAICRRQDVLFHTDAVQAAGHIPIDVHASQIDLLSLSAHKFHGPKGIGVLYARKGIELDKRIEGGEQERNKRAGTENVPAIVGMAVAFSKACEEIESARRRLVPMRDRLIEGLERIPRSHLNGDRNERLPGNVNFSFEGVEGEALLLYLDDKGICASSGSACGSGSLAPSHVLLAIGRDREEARGSLRLTLSDENTMEEVDYLVETVTAGVARLRALSPIWNGRRR